MCFFSIAILLLFPEYHILWINISDVAGTYQKAGPSLWLLETTEIFISLHFT